MIEQRMIAAKNFQMAFSSAMQNSGKFSENEHSKFLQFTSEAGTK